MCLNQTDIHVVHFNVCTRHEAHTIQAHTVCITQFDNNRHERFVVALGVGPATSVATTT